MAEGKKSFIAYSDWKETFDALPDEVAGQLIKHIFAYVNDENPKADFIVTAVFANIKNTLKRDLDKWERQIEQRSKAGKASAEARATKSNDRSNSLNEAQRNPTVSDSVSVNDSVKTKEDIESRKLKFAHTLSDFNSVYSRDLLKDFYDYWTETNENGKKFRREMQKTWNLSLRLKKWESNNKKFIKNGNNASAGTKQAAKFSIIEALQQADVSDLIRR